MSKRNRIALIDADIIVYQACSATLEENDWGDGDGAYTSGNFDAAIRVARILREKWTAAAGCKQSVMCWSDRATPKSSFRYFLLPTYKGQRASKPANHNSLLAHLRDTADSRGHLWRGLEGDDVIGLLLTREPKKYISVSLDKDMLTLPGMHFNPHPGHRRVGIVTDDIADWNWMYQTLVGDRVDNYKGCPGVGEAGAKKLLGLPGDKRWTQMWPEVVNAFRHANYMKAPETSQRYARRHGTLEFAIQQAQCARILRNGDYNEKRGEVRVWHPTVPFWLNPLTGERRLVDIGRELGRGV